jgi:phage-related protein (TIGR01555 family)
MFFTRKKELPTSTEPPIETRRASPNRDALIEVIKRRNFISPDGGKVGTTDYAGQALSGIAFGEVIPHDILTWYANQGFIGYQACMLMSQHWLINAACQIPVQDALRKGYIISGNDGQEISADDIVRLQAFDKQIKLQDRLTNFGHFARVFGYRIAIFKVESDDEDYYLNPFNPDGVTKGSYKGIALPDPYHVVPLMSQNGFHPADIDFYEPEYWQIQGKKYHKSHCIIYRHCEVASLLKPAYMYGGISLVQQIYEAVHSAIGASNEANMLLMTKRLNVLKGDVEAAISDQLGFDEKIEFLRATRDNHGYQLIGIDEDLVQLETALAEVTNVIAQKFQLVASVARMPTNILMQTPLEGFGSQGESEEAVYHGMLETLHEHCFAPLLERHYICAQRSLGLNPFELEIRWNSLDTLTAQEQAQVNLIKAQSDEVYVGLGAIAGEDVRKKLQMDKDSGYDGIDGDMPEQPEPDLERYAT